MNKIRLLFAPENIGFADKIAHALASQGYQATADDGPTAAALVVWSPAAAVSTSILAAARSALARRVLVPVALGKSPPPPSFEHLWPMDLAGWSGRDDDPRWRFVLDEVELAVRRGAEISPRETPAKAAIAAPLAEDRAAAPRRVAPSPVSAPPGAPHRPPQERFEDVFADPATLDARRRARPGPRAPRAAIAAALAVIALPIGAFIFGSAQRTAMAPAGPSPGPVVAFVEPKNQPAEEIERAPEAPPEPVATAPAPQISAAEDERVAAETLRDGAPAASLENTAPETEPALPEADQSEPRIKPVTIGSLAEAATAESSPMIDEAIAPEAGATAPGEVDQIAALVSTASREEANESVSFGNYFRDCVDCPDMAEIHGDAIAAQASGVALPAGFAIGVHEVTFAEWRACVADGACPPIAAQAGAGGQALPVIKVSYADASTYAAWLSAKTGVKYRLPSEAEWEFAARAGGPALGIGVPPDPSAANIRGPQLFRGRTTPAGSFAPNGFGLYDMAGNVWEWTEDCAAAAPTQTAAIEAVPASDATAPAPNPCAARVVKGGAFDTPASGVADAYRAAAPTDDRRKNTGFRVARDIR